jgi:hypothetical protein
MLITQAHIDFYRAKKVPATSLQQYVKKPFNVKWYSPTSTIDILINSQVKDMHKGTEPHNIISFLRGYRHRGLDSLLELRRMAYAPYSTDPKRRTAYAKKWYMRLAKQRREATA